MREEHTLLPYVRDWVVLEITKISAECINIIHPKIYEFQNFGCPWGHSTSGGKIWNKPKRSFLRRHGAGERKNSMQEQKLTRMGHRESMRSHNGG